MNPLQQFNLGRPSLQQSVLNVGSYRMRQITLTDAQLQALDVTPITVAPAEPGRILLPIEWWIRTNKPGAAGWTTGPATRLIHEGNNTAINLTTNPSSQLNSAGAVNQLLGGSPGFNTAAFVLTTFNRIGKAIQVQFASVATKGGGSNATMDVCVTYFSAPLTL